MTPLLQILWASAAAAASSAIGVVPLVGREGVPKIWIGWSDALAGGMMLGLVFLLTTTMNGPTGGVGVFLGILFIFATRGAIDGGGVLARLSLERDSPSSRQLLFQGVLHSASEGIAIAAAWVTDSRFGIFMALAVALHNIPEGTLLAAAQRRRGLTLVRAAIVVVAANLSQIALAVAGYVLILAIPAMAPWVTGFAAGALVHLVMAELLPDAYRYAGATSIALVISIAMGIVALGGGLLL